MIAHRAFVFGLASVSLIYAQQTVNLSGTVKNQFNNPMVGATVKLLGTTLSSAKTSSTGAFTLSGQATSISNVKQARAPAAFKMNARGGNLEISIREPARASVELFDAHGALIGAARFSEGTTSAVVPLAGRLCNALFARVNVGDRVYTERYTGTNQSSGHSATTSYQASDRSGSAKQAAAAAVGQLIVLHETYAYDTVDINSFTGSVTLTVNIPDLSNAPFKTLWPKGGEVLSRTQTIWLVVGVNPGPCDGNPEFYCQASLDAGLNWKKTTAGGQTCNDGPGDNFPCMIEYTGSFWDANSIDPNIPGYFMFMDQQKSFALCFWRCDLSGFVGTQTVWMAESRYCSPNAISNPFTVQ